MIAIAIAIIITAISNDKNNLKIYLYNKALNFLTSRLISCQVENDV